jgi:hypothetical protein
MAPSPAIAALRAHAERARDCLDLELAELLEALARTVERIGVDSTCIALRCARPLRRDQ